MMKKKKSLLIKVLNTHLRVSIIIIMKKILTTLLLISSSQLEAKIELLDRIAIIVDDGVVMESQINKAREALEEGYRKRGCSDQCHQMV